MTRSEFAMAMAYVGTAMAKPLSAEAHEVYFELLGDLNYQTLMVAVKRVLLEHRFPTFPSVAELRQAAAETIRGEAVELSECEAWGKAWQIVGDTDPEVEGSFERACRRAKAPPLVVEAIVTMGLNAMCYGDEPVGVVRGQFLKVFAQLAARERRLALLPPALRTALSDIRDRPALPAANEQKLDSAFAMPVE
jgi:hypothetical protein